MLPYRMLCEGRGASPGDKAPQTPLRFASPLQDASRGRRYDAIAEMHTAKCIEQVNSEPPGHTCRVLKLLEMAKEKTQSWRVIDMGYLTLLIGGPFLMFVGLLYLLNRRRNNVTGILLMGIGTLMLMFALFG